MNWKVEYLPEAEKDLKGLDGSQRNLVLKAIKKVQQNPLPVDEQGYSLKTWWMSHKAFYKIIDIVRSKNIPLRYFTSASATKGAEQVVAADSGK